jgi:hypothetical protein
LIDHYKAVGLFSGGLDSILTAKIIRDEGFEVTVLHFYTGFNGKLSREIAQGPGWKWTPAESVVKAAEKLGVTLVPMDISDEYVNILLHPRFGRGSGVNPCIDCHIIFLEKARECMEADGAAFVFTGEVLGQRPMSQHRQTLAFIEKKCGLEGRLVRPLSAKLLEPTIPEKTGILNRERLYDFNGRSRKPQERLAGQFGIDFYPQPGGGCILTDKAFRRKFDDFVHHADGREITRFDLATLKTGRHLRLINGIKLIAGRNEQENEYLSKLLAPVCWFFDAEDFPGSWVFAFGEPSEEDFPVISAICARYGKGSGEETVSVAARKGGSERKFLVRPAEHKDIEPLMIG